jgi:hypothetical protein
MLNAKDRPTDVFGAPMYVDPAGSWFSPMSMTVPAALGVLQTLSLDFLKSEDTDDPVTRSLPLPHMLQRLGLTAMMARRYTPEVYKVVKEALSHVDRSVDDCWDAAGKGHAGLGRMLSTKHAALAVAPATVSLSLQLHWGRAPTVKVRPTLIARIRFVDISSKLKASLVTAPFPFSYVHFGHADPVAQVSFNSGQDEKQFDMTGVFVRQLTHDGGRSLELSFVWQKQGAPMESWISTLLLKIEDGAGQTLEWCIDQALQEAQAPNETREAERAAAEELVKVLFYMGSRDARSIVVTERADAMKDVGKRNAAQQAKVIERARGLYDHILVGPERGMFGDGVDGMSRRQTKVFVRRGHVHGYWTGKGRTVYEAKILDPIVVNRRLLQDGEEPPMPKNYTLH